MAIGLRKTQLMTIVLLPQAVTTMLPAVVSQLVVIVKDTALGGILVGYVELRRAANTSASYYGNLLPTYVVVAVIYIVINMSLSTLSHYLERKLRTRRGGGPVVEIDDAEENDLMASRQSVGWERPGCGRKSLIRCRAVRLVATREWCCTIRCCPVRRAVRPASVPPGSGRAPTGGPVSRSTDRSADPAGGQPGALAGDLGGPGLPDDGDPHLTGVGQFLFDLLGDLPGQHVRLEVVDHVGLDHHPQFAAGLHGEDLLHAALGAGDRLDPSPVAAHTTPATRGGRPAGRRSRRPRPG